MVLALPTGAGKTVIFSELARRARHPVLVLAHRDELVRQACVRIETMLRRDPSDARVVAVEQGEQQAAGNAAIVVASIRTLHEGRIGRVLGKRDVRLVIYDECHHAVASANRRVLEQIGAFEDDWPGTLVGFTATTRRADGRGLGEVFEEIVYHRSLREMIDDGYLRPLTGLRFDTGIDIGRVAAGNEDFEPAALEAAVDVRARNLLVARAIQECTRDRRTIAFCVGVGHARNLCRELRGLGIAAGLVHGDTPKAERAETLARFARGELQVMTNVGVLTEGFDDPGVSAIAMVRPTRSEATYLQCVGRGMRLSPDAKDCLVLDFVDLSGLQIITTPSLDAAPTIAGAQPGEPDEGGHGEVPIDQHDDTPATLAEIQQRLAIFDPLTLVQREEAASISLNAWVSLGALGMMLHFQARDGELRCFELRPRGRAGAAVWLGGERLAECSTMSAAIEAVDRELPRHGVPASARPDAAWRRAPPPQSLRDALLGLRPPRVADDVGTAIAHLALARALRQAHGNRPAV